MRTHIGRCCLLLSSVFLLQLFIRTLFKNGTVSMDENNIISSFLVYHVKPSRPLQKREVASAIFTIFLLAAIQDQDFILK